MQNVSNQRYFVYILKSLNFNRFYIGYSSNPKTRLAHHNQGDTPSTKHYAPYKIVYLEEHSTRSAALAREKQIKTYKHGNAFRHLVEQNTN